MNVATDSNLGFLDAILCFAQEQVGKYFGYHYELEIKGWL
jgi:hypothetical protein